MLTNKRFFTGSVYLVGSVRNVLLQDITDTLQIYLPEFFEGDSITPEFIIAIYDPEDYPDKNKELRDTLISLNPIFNAVEGVFQASNRMLRKLENGEITKLPYSMIIVVDR